jgi:hypothetical protein
MTAIALFTHSGLAAFRDLIALIVEIADGNEYQSKRGQDIVYMGAEFTGAYRDGTFLPFNFLILPLWAV